MGARLCHTGRLGRPGAVRGLRRRSAGGARWPHSPCLGQQLHVLRLLARHGILVLAFALRDWKLVVAAAVVVGFHVSWVLPDYRGAASIPAEAWNAPRVKVFSVNLLFDNRAFSAIIAEIAASDPDLLLLQEFTSEAEAEVSESSIATKLPYHVSAPGGAFGTAIYSRYPLTDAEVWDVAGIPMTRATVTVDGRRLRIFNVHPVSPSGRSALGLWNQEWLTILVTVREEQGNLMVAGDFNITQHHRWYAEMKATGMRAAHELRGRGNATTWPNGKRKLRAIRIDDVFVSDGAVPLGIREGRGEASDHKPVIVEIALIR